MEAIAQKGVKDKDEIVNNIKEVLSDRSKVKTDGIQLKQIFLEVLFTKYGAQSLEHVTRGIERVKPILMDHYQN